jgi:hypothetical protein
MKSNGMEKGFDGSHVDHGRVLKAYHAEHASNSILTRDEAGRFGSAMPWVSRLQVQALWLALALRLQDSFPCRAEVLHVHPHSSLAKGQETGLGTDGLDISTRQIVLLVDKLVQIDILVQRHLGGVEGEDLLLGGLCGIVRSSY